MFLMAETTIKNRGKQEHVLESKFCKVLGTQNLEAWLQCLSLLLMTEKNLGGGGAKLFQVTCLDNKVGREMSKQ